MPTIDRNGVEIYYESEGSGPPMLLSHGYGATCRMWDGQVAALADRHRVIARHERSGDPALWPNRPITRFPAKAGTHFSGAETWG
jgi:pimeloyl-ACP methyl ester carboxylesterase